MPASARASSRNCDNSTSRRCPLSRMIRAMRSSRAGSSAVVPRWSRTSAAARIAATGLLNSWARSATKASFWRRRESSWSSRRLNEPAEIAELVVARRVEIARARPLVLLAPNLVAQALERPDHPPAEPSGEQGRARQDHQGQAAQRVAKVASRLRGLEREPLEHPLADRRRPGPDPADQHQRGDGHDQHDPERSIAQRSGPRPAQLWPAAQSCHRYPTPTTVSIATKLGSTPSSLRRSRRM